MTAREAVERYEREAGPKYAALVRRYLQWGGSNADATFTRYLKHLAEKEGLAPGSIDLHRRTICAFYRHFRIPAPKAKGFKYDPKDAHRPAFSTEVIARFISEAKAGNLTNRQTCLLALATTYGLRAGEMAAVQAQDVDRDGQRIYLRTLKGGQSRWCWLPPELSPFLQDEWPSCTPNSVEVVFNNLWGTILEVEKPNGTNFHAVRRALVRDLVGAGVPDSSVGRFLRWAAGGTRGPEKMVNLYARPSATVGEEGSTPAREEDEGHREFDRDVWDRHPYLPLWR